MAIPKNTIIPKGSGQFMKFQEGANRVRFLSNVTVGWEGWKDKKPFRHEGSVCQITPDQVDLNQNHKPNINYFWAMAVWNYTDKSVQVLEVTQKTIMSQLFNLEQNADWGDLKGYDVEVTKKTEGDKTSYMVAPIPPKPLSVEIEKAYSESKIDLRKLFEGEYPMPKKEYKDGEVPPNQVPDLTSPDMGSDDISF